MNDYILHLCESFRGMFFVTCLFFLFCLAEEMMLFLIELILLQIE